MDCFAQRLKKIPPYLFAELDELKQKTKGEVIDFGEGGPDSATPKPIVQAMIKALQNSEYHRYPTYQGMIGARVAVADWYQGRFGVKLDPAKEVCMLIGSKEGVGHLIWGVVGYGDKIGIPDPSYPIYRNQALLSGAVPSILPLLETNDYLPDLSRLRNQKIKLICINYPNNPTAAVAPLSFYKELVALAQREGFYVLNDNVYSEIYFDSPPPSILQVNGAKECCVEFHSLSKTFNMAGWRIGFVVGNKNLITAMLKIKQNTDSGPFSAIQETAIFALRKTGSFAKSIRTLYRRRRDTLVKGLQRTGWNIKKPAATFFVWAKIKDKIDSITFTRQLLARTKIMVAPGIGFGKYGEGFIRFALVVPESKIKQAIMRLNRWH